MACWAVAWRDVYMLAPSNRMWLNEDWGAPLPRLCHSNIPVAMFRLQIQQGGQSGDVYGAGRGQRDWSPWKQWSKGPQGVPISHPIRASAASVPALLSALHCGTEADRERSLHFRFPPLDHSSSVSECLFWTAGRSLRLNLLAPLLALAVNSAAQMESGCWYDY